MVITSGDHEIGQPTSCGEPAPGSIVVTDPSVCEREKADSMPKLTTLLVVMVILNLIGLTIAAYFIMRRK
jgi:hypothetical protein